MRARRQYLQNFLLCHSTFGRFTARRENMITRWMVGSFVALALAFSGPAGAQTYPAKPVRILIPFPPAGPSDFAARIIGAKLAEFLGQPVIPDNRPGAGGALATEMGARATPDGYVLL